MKQLFSSQPIWANQGIGIIRIIIGCLLIFHGWEVFDAAKMNGYVTWDMFKNNSSGKFLVYLAKSAEFVAGILFVLGFFTRIASLLTIATFIGITFFVGHGKFWMDDQHPFLFAVFGLLFFFTGAGSFSLDKLILKNK
jgi:putative oxidoreductase